MNKKRTIILVSVLLILLTGFAVFYALRINRSINYLPEKYDQYKIGKATLYFDNGKLTSSDIYVKFEENRVNLIFKNNKLTVTNSSEGTFTDINGAMLKEFVDTIIKDFRNIAGYEAYKADIISESHFLEALKTGTEVLQYSTNSKTLQLGTYDGTAGLGAATVIDKEISKTTTIIITE